jgi:peptide/nickel transport system ATP-binding protein
VFDTDVQPCASSSTAPSRTADDVVLDASDLSIAFRKGQSLVDCVHNVNLALRRGEVLALVGESGSGKTLIARSIPGLLPPGAHQTSGRVRLGGLELTSLPHSHMRRVRGRRIGMVFQEPMVSLNPSRRVGAQILDAMRVHHPEANELERRAVEMLERLRVTEARRRLRQYPHELSGGLQQRVMIAAALLPRPELLLADEPTTALDAIIQREVMELMLEAARDLGCAVLLITHDLGVVADYAQRVLVLRQGSVVEQGPVREVIGRPAHEYTAKLLASLPTAPPASAAQPAQQPWLVVDNVSVIYRGRRAFPWRRPARIAAVRGVSLGICRGECVALVGESGSGKTTLGRAMLGLSPIAEGRITLADTVLSSLDEASWRPLRPRLQFVFQDPWSSLNPRMRIGRIVAEGLRRSELSGAEKLERVQEVLEEVGLESSFADRLPHQLSGGQRQRVGIARALVSRPELVVADEPVAALDLTVQAQILELLEALQKTRGFTLVFISHDLAVVSRIADRVFVMNQGWIVESGPVAEVFRSAAHPYTRALLAAAPYLDTVPETGEYVLRHRALRTPENVSGNRFFQPGEAERPEYRTVGRGHLVATGRST